MAFEMDKRIIGLLMIFVVVFTFALTEHRVRTETESVEANVVVQWPSKRVHSAKPKSAAKILIPSRGK